MHSPSKFFASCSRALLVFVALLAFAGCGKKGALDGTYSEAGSDWKFQGDTVTVTRKGAAGGAQMKYTVDGKKVTFTAGKYTSEGTINADGSVTTDGLTLVKK